jgi:hypothetical protein
MFTKLASGDFDHISAKNSGGFDKFSAKKFGFNLDEPLFDLWMLSECDLRTWSQVTVRANEIKSIKLFVYC